MTMPKFEPVAWRFTAPGITKLDNWPHGGKWHELFTSDQLTEAYEAGKREQAAELEAARAEIAHWKNNHATEVRRARILKERIDMPIERVAAYEQWGKDQRQLAAEQANNVRLREALHYSLGAWHYDGVSDEHGSIFKEANDRCDAPSDTSALEAVVKKAGEVMRERCIEYCETRHTELLEPEIREVVEVIRDLPAVTLEDLK